MSSGQSPGGISSPGLPIIATPNDAHQHDFDRSHALDDADIDLELGSDADPDETAREIVEKSEEPGMDSLRGTFGAIGTIIRARRRARALSIASAAHASRSSLSLSTSHHSQERAGSKRTSAGTNAGWLSGRWSNLSPPGSRFQPVEEDQDPGPDVDMEKGAVVVEVGAQDEKVAEDHRESSYSAGSQAPSIRDLSNAPTAIPLHTLRSQSTLRSRQDTMVSGETSSPMVPSIVETDTNHYDEKER